MQEPSAGSQVDVRRLKTGILQAPGDLDSLPHMPHPSAPALQDLLDNGGATSVLESSLAATLPQPPRSGQQ